MELALGAVLARAENNAVFAGRECQRRDLPLAGLLLTVGQPAAGELGTLRARVIQLDPIGEIAVRVRDRGFVGGLQLTEDDCGPKRLRRRLRCRFGNGLVGHGKGALSGRRTGLRRGGGGARFQSACAQQHGIEQHKGNGDSVFSLQKQFEHAFGSPLKRQKSNAIIHVSLPFSPPRCQVSQPSRRLGKISHGSAFFPMKSPAILQL